MWMGQTKTLQVGTYSCEDGIDEDSAGGYFQLLGWGRRRLPVATYSYEDGTDENSAGGYLLL